MELTQRGGEKMGGFLRFLYLVPNETYNKGLRQGCGLWINNFSVQNCVRKIFISQQQKIVLKIAKCQNNRKIDSFPYMQKHLMFFFRNTTYLTICPKRYFFFSKKL